jgi:enoyl-CoA hydratase/carnithine racemase
VALTTAFRRTGNIEPCPSQRRRADVPPRRRRARRALADALAVGSEALARQIARKRSSAVHIGKRAFRDQLGLPLDKTYEMTGAVMAENMLNRDTAEGVAAFLDKCDSEWSQPE